jgi:hypothetical protein
LAIENFFFFFFFTLVTGPRRDLSLIESLDPWVIDSRRRDERRQRVSWRDFHVQGVRLIKPLLLDFRFLFRKLRETRIGQLAMMGWLMLLHPLTEPGNAQDSQPPHRHPQHRLGERHPQWILKLVQEFLNGF